MAEERTPGWVGAAAARADEILEKCRRRNGAPVADVAELHKTVFAVADEVLRLQRVVAEQGREITELRHPKRSFLKATGPAS